MLINTRAIFSMTQANINFSSIARIVEQEGRALILKHSKPRFLVLDIKDLSVSELDDLERLIRELRSNTEGLNNI